MYCYFGFYIFILSPSIFLVHFSCWWRSMAQSGKGGSSRVGEQSLYPRAPLPGLGPSYDTPASQTLWSRLLSLAAGVSHYFPVRAIFWFLFCPSRFISIEVNLSIGPAFFPQFFNFLFLLLLFLSSFRGCLFRCTMHIHFPGSGSGITLLTLPFL